MKYRNPHDHPVDLADGSTLEPHGERDLKDEDKDRADALGLEPVHAKPGTRNRTAGGDAGQE